MRLIDADRLLEDMGASCLPIMEKGISEITGDESTIKDHIDSAPTIDAVPVVHARFGFVGPDLSVYRYDTRYGTCSACKRRIVFVPNQTNFCPNCGAKMDGEADG